MSNNKPKYKVVDLFAGAGGLSLGFSQTGRFEIVAAFENNSNANQTFRKNHTTAKVYGDVSETNNLDLGEVDVVIGGPPCQGFSNANRQKNHAISQNNSLVKQFVKIVLALKPKAFVMENVSMLKSEVHRFFVDEYDESIIDTYHITTQLSEIQLLESKFMFENAVEIVSSLDKIEKFLWKEDEYLVLNIIYKARNNTEKLKKSLEKHRSKMLILAEKLLRGNFKNNYISSQEKKAGSLIKDYFLVCDISKRLAELTQTIEKVIMIQRMLSKAKEIHENKIIVEEYNTQNGLIVIVRSMAVIDYIESILGANKNGYNLAKGVLSAASFGAPQKRMRFLIIGIRNTSDFPIELPKGRYVENNYRTVRDAISDLENFPVSIRVTEGNIGVGFEETSCNLSELCKDLRDSSKLYNHVSTNTTQIALDRFRHLKQGENFHDLPEEFKSSYSDSKRTQNTIYLRLKYDLPSGTVLNVRKSMWIHPKLDRAISIREAARLQTFPDSFVFYGTKDSQYQQVGNAVPPVLAKAIASRVCEYLDALSVESFQ